MTPHPATPWATIKISQRLSFRRRAILLAFAPLFLATACGAPNGAHRSSPPPSLAKKPVATPVIIAPLQDAPKPTTPADAPSRPMIGPADNSATTRPAETAETGPAIASIAPTLASIATTPKPPPSPDRLLGMSGPTVAGLLGPAKLVRRDGDAEIWQYRNDHCVLDVFLYGPGPLSVAHVDLRKRRRGTRDKNVCYAELARKANAGR